MPHTKVNINNIKAEPSQPKGSCCQVLSKALYVMLVASVVLLAIFNFHEIEKGYLDFIQWVK